MSDRMVEVLLAAIMTIVAVFSFHLAVQNYHECRNHGFTARYCLTSIGR